MASLIKIKRSATSGKRPTLEQVALGELALNTYDGYLFTERDTGGVGIGTTVTLLTPWTENYGAGSIYYQNNVGIGTTNTYNVKLSVDGTVKVTGISTFTDRVIFDSTNSIQIPSGTTAQRDAVGTAVTGQIRFNTELSSFEGYGPGGEWGSLGGVKDVDQDTFIRAEVSAGSDEDTLEFLTAGSVKVSIDSNGNVGIGTTNPTKALDVVGFGGTSNGIRVGDIHFFAFGDANKGTKGSPTFQNLNTNSDTVLRVLPNGTGKAQFEFFATDYFASAGIGTTTWNNLRIFANNNQGEIRIDTSAATEAGVAKSISIETNVSPGGGTRPNQYQLYLDINGNIGLGTNTPSSTLDVDGTQNVSGLSTFASNVDINADLDVDGHTELDNLNVSGVSTFSDDVIVGTATTGVVARTDGTLNVSGDVSFGSTATFGDDDRLRFGAGNDLEIFHNSANNNSIIKENGSGNLVIAADNFVIRNSAVNEDKARFNTNAAVELYYDNVKKFETTGAGVSVYGTTQTQQLNVSGVSTLGTVKISSGIITSTSGVVTYYGDGQYLDLTDSVALGGDTTGDYVQSITGTPNEVEVTGGSGESSTPQIGLPNNVTIGQDLTITRDLQVTRNLNVDGNITIGGTSATLFTQTLQVADADLILGIRTDSNGEDISTDNTANHGGIAIASTEGTPLVTLVNPGAGETLPSTYKKIMWFKSGSFSGLGTDAWLSNYAIGIGSTQVPDGVRLAAGGVQITENDISVVRDINASGIATLPTIDATNATIDNLTFTSGTAITSVDTDLTAVSSSDDTLASAKAIKTYVDTQVTAQDLDFAGDSGTGAVDLDTQSFSIFGTTNEIETVGSGQSITIGLPNVVAITTSLIVGDSTGITGVSTFFGDVNIGTGATTAFFDVSSGSVGIGTETPTQKLHVEGNALVNGNLYLNDTNYLSSLPTGSFGSVQINGSGKGNWQGYSIDGNAVFMSAGPTASFGLYDDVNNHWAILHSRGGNSYTEIRGGNNSPNLSVHGTDVRVQYVPLIVNSTTLTGTASQNLQVTGGAYVSGDVGIGVTNPDFKLHIESNFNGGGIFLDDTSTSQASPYIRVRGKRSDDNFSQSFSGQLILEKNQTNGPTIDGRHLGAIIFGGNYDASPGVTTGMTYGASMGAISEGEFSGINTAPTALVFRTGTVGLGTLGTANINFGDTESLRINSNNNILIGSVSETGTASQKLQVTSGAYVSGDVGIGITNPSEELHVLGAAVISSDTATLGDDYSTLTIGERPAGDGYASLAFKNDTNAFNAKIDGTSAGINIWGNKNSINDNRFVWNGASTTEHVSLRPRAQDVLRAQHDGTNGRVGINITAPEAALDIKTGYGTSYTGTFTAPYSYTPTTSEIKIGSVKGASAQAGDYVGLRFSVIGNNSGNANAGIFAVREQAEGDGRTSLAFATRNWGANTNLTEKVRITSDGDVGIGTTTPTEKLDVIGTVKAIDFDTTSDQNLKTNIKIIEDPLEKIVQIRGVNFEWKENNKPSAGVIAQEVEKVLPELVTNNGTRAVNYNGLIGLLVEAVKAQQKEIDILKSKIK